MWNFYPKGRGKHLLQSSMWMSSSFVRQQMKDLEFKETDQSEAILHFLPNILLSNNQISHIFTFLAFCREASFLKLLQILGSTEHQPQLLS